MLQCVAVLCDVAVLVYVAAMVGVVAVYCSVLQHVAVPDYVATWICVGATAEGEQGIGDVLQCVAV